MFAGKGVMSPIQIDEIETTADQGRTVGLALACQRDLTNQAARYPGLFPADRFGPSLFAGLCLANAFGAPWSTADQLRFLTRVALWVFAADWQVDDVTRSRADLDDLLSSCLRTASGDDGIPATQLAEFLADIARDLNSVPEFSGMRAIWSESLARFLVAMTREWEWRASASEGGPLPGVPEYLGNADSTAASFVNVSYWIYSRDMQAIEHIGALTTAGALVQQVLRLLNDLASYERDLVSGDLNVLTLGIGHAEVTELITGLVARCREQIEPLKGPCPRAAAYLERQIGFSAGFYRLTDYWSGQ
ncbi:terpene synthase family protein [Microbispora bryophytorum]|uniref:terpene synthase family protein n=1 Tax=Microbispora bryophytorum TaxID=1460882 RepID=UPI0037211B4C